MYWASFRHVLGIIQTCFGHHPDMFRMFVHSKINQNIKKNKNINALFFRGLKAFKEGENKIAIENWTLLLDQIQPDSQMALELFKKINKNASQTCLDDAQNMSR